MSSTDSRPRRLTVWFTGRVQGVGFRATCSSIARGFQVTGYVCNLHDGRVECIAEGCEDELIGFLDRIIEEMKRYIVAHQAFWSEATGQWDGFRIERDK